MIKNSNKYFSPLFKFQQINGIWLVQKKKKTFLLVTRGACQSSYRKWKPACHLGDEKRRLIIETRQILSLLQPINHCTSGVDVIWSRHPTKLGLIETEVKRDGVTSSGRWVQRFSLLALMRWMCGAALRLHNTGAAVLWSSWLWKLCFCSISCKVSGPNRGDVVLVQMLLHWTQSVDLRWCCDA